MNAFSINETRRLMKVTPQMAKEWLEQSVGNRLISSQSVAKYTETMLMGRWKAIKSEPIVFSTDGKLMNGHHRLFAVIRSNRAIDFWVEFDEDASNMLYLDDGRSRKPADNKFIMTGDPNCHYRERIAKIVLAYFGTDHSTTSFGIASLEAAEAGLKDAFDQLVTSVDKLKGKVAAPYLAALSYFQPLYPQLTIEIARDLTQRRGEKGSAVGAILSLMSNGRNTSNTGNRNATFSATVGALEHAVNNRKIEFAKPNDSAVTRITILRERQGLWVPPSAKIAG